MLSRIKNLFFSFSFRVGLLFFVAICSTLLILRVQAYYQSLSTSYEDIRALINAHDAEIDQGIEKYGASFAKYLVNALIEEAHDRKLYLLFRDGKYLTGNLDEWPPELDPDSDWQEITVNQGEDRPPLHLLVKLSAYKHKTYTMLIGYDLQRIDQLRDTLLRVAIGNALLSLLVSFAISVAVVWLINFHLHRVNRACARVMHGEMQHRIKVSGGDDQFDKLGGNINAMLDWISSLLSTVRESTNALAHDMRTPLSRHRLELQALAASPDVPPKAQEKIRAAVARVDGIVGMFDDILSIARAESRSSTEMFAAFNVSETVADVAAFYDALVEEKKQALTTDLPPAQMVGDKQLVAQATVNLIDNAIKYTPEGGHISVSLRQKDGNIVITVADNGPGIPDELLEKAKTRFFRADESRHTPGTGLGLSLVEAVAGLHHGTLTLADNNPGLRATLTLAADFRPEKDQP